MAKYGIIRGRKTVDPNFNIEAGDTESVYDTRITEFDETEEELDLNTEAGGLETPQILDVIQRYRQDDTGRTVVDVILIVEDIKGIVKYDTRIGVAGDTIVVSGGT